MDKNFTPDFKPYSGVHRFRFWCQKVLPLVYDDSLSYYELLNKVVYYLNSVISDVANVEDNLVALRDAFVELQDYVNSVVEGIDEEIEKVFDQMVEDGTIGELVDEAIGNTIVETYDPDEQYIAGDYVIKDGTVYRANDSTTGTFDPTKWTPDVYIANDLSTAFRMINQKVDTDDLWYITPEMYGAVGDGTTDDTQAFLSAVQVINTSNVKALVLQNKNYLIKQGLVFNKAVIIKGIMPADNGSSSPCLMTDSTTPFDFITLNAHGSCIENIRIDGNGGHGIIINANHCQFKAIDVLNCDDAYRINGWANTYIGCCCRDCNNGFHIITTITSSSFISCICYDITNIAWYFAEPVTYTSLINCGMDRGKKAIWLYQAGIITLYNFGAEKYESLGTFNGKAVLIQSYGVHRRTTTDYTITGTGNVTAIACTFTTDDTFSIDDFYCFNCENAPSNKVIHFENINDIAGNTAKLNSFGVTELSNGTIADSASNYQLQATVADADVLLVEVINDSNIQSFAFVAGLFRAGYNCYAKWNDSNTIIVHYVDSTHINVTKTGSGFTGVRIYKLKFS